MSLILRSYLELEGVFFKRCFDKLTKNPESSQMKYLMKIIRNNSGTLYGKEHGFSNITSTKDFRDHVPINQYNDLEPYVTKMANGEQNVLTSEEAFMFNLTSGTTAKPKYIPVTPSVKRHTLRLNHHWLYRALHDHPSFLKKANLTITSSAIEGYTPASIPFGSMSGLIYKNLKRPIKSCFVLPFIVSEIKNYKLRYYAMSRLALGKDVSFVATPNPTTLLKLAEVGVEHQLEIIRSVHDGKLLINTEFEISPEDMQIVKAIEFTLRANPSRASFLESVLNDNGSLIPQHCWPSLKLIACWLGGSAGYQADKLLEYYGNVPKRDLGYLASEGCMTLPISDNTPAGVLALTSSYYEFIPEESTDVSGPEILECHELEMGKLYRVLLTNESGLYRYDINDIVRVDGYYNNTPMLAFVRKTSNILNITGEKVHVNQLIMTIQEIQSKYNIEIKTFRVAKNQDLMLYDMMIAMGKTVNEKQVSKFIILAVDEILSKLNVEYSQKRKSRRLGPPRIHFMDETWADIVKNAAIKSGKRDIQYKWEHFVEEMTDLDRSHIKFTVEFEE